MDPMKIGSLPVVAMEQYQNTKIRTRKAETAPMGTDSVELSSASRLFDKALAAAREAPEVRMDRVETVRAQVTAGTYRIDTAAIAARLLAGISGE
jgi:negative regulator of flagellin synthesis FlgM